MEPVAGGTLWGVKPFVLAVLVSLLLAGSARADVPAGFTRGAKLEAAASFVAGKPVTVWCAATEYIWEQSGGTAHEFGLAVPGSSEIRLAPDVCRFLRVGKLQDGFGAAILVLTHEAIHARGEKDEGVTDCAAVHEMPRVAVKFFHVKAGKQLRAVMANAWAYRSRETADYRATC